MRLRYLRGTAIATALAAAGWTGAAAAQSTSSSPADTEVEAVVVTGSRLLTTRQADALPLRIVSAEELEAQGSPALVDVIRSMPEVAGSIGNSNSSQAGKGQGFEASESFNLRGLGAERNLVLFNGRRMPLVSGTFVNTRSIPMAAIGRLEVLKDAASTTYGSDAMSGVVNFITRDDLEGLELSGRYTWIADSDGDYELDAAYGRQGEGWSLLLAGGYQQRGRLRVIDRPWSTPPYSVNPDAGWNFSSNPAQFTPVGTVGPGGVLAATGPRVLDSGCLPLGGIEPFAGFCVNNVQKWQDLVAPAETWQLYGELKYDLSDTTQLWLEATYAEASATVHYPPSFNQPKPITETVLPANINPASYIPGTSPRLFSNWFVPMTNPGLAAYAAANPGQFPAGTTGIFIPIGQWRPYLLGGNPFFGGPGASARQTRDQIQYRLSAGLTGSIGDDFNWSADVSYGRNEHTLLGWDSTGVQIELALRGLGGPNCAWQTAAPGSAGCLWLNPMSNAIESAPINGVASNPSYNAAVANTKELADWLMVPQARYLTSEITELNFAMDGGLGGLALGGGDVRWAAGVQWRRISFNEHDSEYADRTRVPCLNSPLDIPGADVCTPTPYTPLGLAVALEPVDISTDVYAAFVEVNLPVTERFDVTVGARYEDYGSDGGGTFDPQVRAKLDLGDWVSLRASASSTFRAPPLTSLAPNPQGSIPTILGQPRALDVIGNPDLEPEKATTYSFGVLLKAGGLDAAVDYFHYDVEDILTTEPQNAIVNAVFPNGAGGANNCASVDPQFLTDHFVFNGACSAAALSKVMLRRINGPALSFSGVDFRANYRIDDVFGGDLTIGVTATRTVTFEFDPFEVAGLKIAGFDAVGKLNAGTLANPLPEWKSVSYLNYQRGPVNLRWSMRYNSAYRDPRQAKTAVGYSIDASTLHDVAAVVDLPYDASLTIAVTNIGDVDPPLARLAEGYDAMTSDPLGRTFRLGLKMKF